MPAETSALKRILMLSAMLTLFGCHRHADTDAISGVTITSEAEDTPKFKRIYTKQLDSRATIKVTIQNYYNGERKYRTGELTQPNGRWVLFDPDAVADKIIDPVLAPLVQRCVDDIYALDAAFMATDPKEFTDSKGVRWVRL